MAEHMRALIALAFSGSLGVMFMVLACALPQYDNWWPFFVSIFYLLSPLPYLLVRRYASDNSTILQVAVFITAGIVVSSFGLPLVLAHAPTSQPVITWGACALVFTGNAIVFATILGFFRVFDEDGGSFYTF